ncbi:MAG TPA: OmpH family outer membrane protein [Candidatus Acidoferrum sp.]|jgi:Skp family chaperone for outer membrane proteins|nr:OmpH family outer membrane protein [Candidatus Acidoferrum sp.]
MDWMRWKIAVVVMAVCGLGAAGLWAQGKPANGGEAGGKVAAINMRAAIANTSEGKQASAQLETEFLARRKELEDLNKKINDLQQRLTAGATTLSDEEKQRLTLEGQRLTRQLERRQNEFQEDLNDAQGDVVARIGRRMVEVLGKYAPSNGYGAVLDNSSQSTPVMYASTDITEEIVRLYDQTYPVKSGAGASDPKNVTKPVAKPSER